MESEEALKQYRAAVAALRAMVDDPAVSAGEILRARRAIEDLTDNFVQSNIDDVRARTVLFREFVARMEGLSGQLARGDVKGPLTTLQKVIDASKAILTAQGDAPAPPSVPAAPGPNGPATTDGPEGSGGPGGPAKMAAPITKAKRLPSGRKGRAKVSPEQGEDPSPPKTVRPEAEERRELPPAVTAAERIGRTLDAQPDRVDVRDWPYEPTLRPLPPFLDNRAAILEVLDQGSEGACTGFALAAVINFLLASQGAKGRVSPRMLYEMARRYDEWPGENYEGSSARGGIKGWVAHGVCPRASWPDSLFGPEHFSAEVALDARAVPGGAYFRVMHREVRDVHAAINETGAVYATLMVHAGWGQPGPLTSPVDPAKSKGKRLKVIRRDGRATDGHAVALVGYNHEGFIVQNSWGKGWGDGGFALLPYEDFLLHATDVWVAQLGVPIAMDLWGVAQGQISESAGLQRAAQSIPLEAIRPYVVDIGNNGELSDSGDYWTTEDDLRRLFEETIPSCVKERGWDKARVLLYLHGGLNGEDAVADRIVAFRDKMLANGIYPLHLMWESGAGETLSNLVRNLFSESDERAGSFGDWFHRLRDNLVEAKDRSLELTLSKPGTALWDEMKRNARTASEHRVGLGGMQLIAYYAQQALAKMSATAASNWELHVVGHSAGAIFATYAMPHLTTFGPTFRSLQFLAPAVTIDLFKARVLPWVAADSPGRRCPHPTMYSLSDVGERDDQVGPYGKSLLYLVSNAFEGERESRILGMERFASGAGVDRSVFDPEVDAFFRRPVDGLPSLVIAGAAPAAEEGKDTGCVSRSQTHGGFDNDPDTLNSVVRRILGHTPSHPFTVSDLSY